MPRSETPGMPANYHGGVRVLAIGVVAACGRFGFQSPAAGDGMSSPIGDAPNIAPADLVAYYPMDKLANGFLEDASGHNNFGNCQLPVIPGTTCPNVVPRRLG